MPTHSIYTHAIQILERCEGRWASPADASVARWAIGLLRRQAQENSMSPMARPQVARLLALVGVSAVGVMELLAARPGV